MLNLCNIVSFWWPPSGKYTPHAFGVTTPAFTSPPAYHSHLTHLQVLSPSLPKVLSSAHFSALHSCRFLLSTSPQGWSTSPVIVLLLVPTTLLSIPIIMPEQSVKADLALLSPLLKILECTPKSFIIKFKLLSTYYKPQFHHASTSVHRSPWPWTSCQDTLGLASESTLGYSLSQH